ncbi:ABC-type sugar transport system periplasmic component [Gaiella occulta]|uniref:ABC-type sugar transport system periplasmic component n=1 Tax=Gaiella occulta TaxID=1002870 RepID=A0A7M2YZZ5_9ACTN|nr:substrate-binding domain-containing protein [Gaiella occulta]RDI75706.1 ABC-type sugar transport system periplasmic component [Gaiella occulta]
MTEHETYELQGEHGHSRRDLLVKGGLITAGAALLGSPAAAFASRGSTAASPAKVAVVTHGDTGSFWSVFKRGVDQAAKDLGGAVKVTQVYAANDVAKQVAGLNAAIAARVNVIATSVPDASALKDPLTKAAQKGIEIITVNSGLGAFDSLRTYEVHVGQTEDVAGEGAGKQFTAAGAKNLVVVVHEASNSGLTLRAAGAKKTFKGSTKTLLIPNATSDLPGTKAKIAAYFKANPKTDAFLGLNPDVTVAALDALPKGTKVGTFDLNAQVIPSILAGRILFAIDQQQYLQGYLPVVFAYLFVTNLNTVGNGAPVLTGPGIVNKANAARVAALAKKGTR